MNTRIGSPTNNTETTDESTDLQKLNESVHPDHWARSLPEDLRWVVARRPEAAGDEAKSVSPEEVPHRMRLSLHDPAQAPRDRREDRGQRASENGQWYQGPWIDVRIPVKISVVIPTLNEEANIRALLPLLPEGLHQVILVDGFSTDGTVEVARSLRPDIEVVDQTRPGKGNAMAHGFAACTGDIIVMMDADGSADPGELSLYITALLNGADFVKGSRYSAGGGSHDLTVLRSAGNRGLNTLVNLMYQTHFTDLCYGYNVFWRHCLPSLRLDNILEAGPDEAVWGDGFEIETLITTRAAKAGLRVVEVPSFEHARIHGVTNLKTFQDGFRVLRTAVVERLARGDVHMTHDEFDRTWCCEFEFTTGEFRSVCPVDERHKVTRALVRRRGVPLGYVTVPRHPDDLDPAMLSAFAGDLVRRPTRPPVEVCDRGPATVVICTRDRTEILGRCLASMRKMTYPNLRFLVVDNAPTDDSTRQLIADLSAQDERFEYVYEPTPGLSQARNTGLRHARTDVVLFTDDDVEVDASWADYVMAAFDQNPEVGCVTGLVATAEIASEAEAYFDARAASWSARMDPILFHPDRADGLYPYSAGVFGTGANLSVRRKAVLDLGGFDTRLGAGTPSRGGEDLDMFVRLLKSGSCISYEPAALVWHHHRADPKSLRRQMYGYGTGLGAYGAKLLSESETRRDVLRKLPRVPRRLTKVYQETDARQVSGSQPPTGVKAIELAGLAAGPWIWSRSR